MQHLQVSNLNETEKSEGERTSHLKLCGQAISACRSPAILSIIAMLIPARLRKNQVIPEFMIKRKRANIYRGKKNRAKRKLLKLLFLFVSITILIFMADKFTGK